MSSRAGRVVCAVCWGAAYLGGGAVLLLGAAMLFLGVPPDMRRAGLGPAMLGLALLLACRARSWAGFLLGAAGFGGLLTRSPTFWELMIIAGIGAALSAAATAATHLWRRRRGTLPPGRTLLPRLGLRHALVAVAVVSLLCWWSTQHLLRARLYLSLGWYGRAAETAMRIPDDEWEALSWEEQVALILGSPASRRLAAFLDEVPSWPFAACVPDGTASPRFDEWSAGANASAYLGIDILPTYIVDWFLLYPREQGVLKAVEASLEGADFPAYPRLGPELRRAGESVAYGDDPDYMSWLSAIRRGHLPVMSSEWGKFICTGCGHLEEPAPGVTEEPSGALTWTRPDGTEVRLPPPAWLPPPASDPDD